ncbi:MAG: beta-propeller domain-containing protein [Deltaproteobacteria bacterium]|nr:beta-propeller domain-containing protein [Deltaproteobacteria bacterium]
MTFVTVGCHSTTEPGPGPTQNPGKTPVVGQTDFVSADGVAGQTSQNRNRGEDLAGAPAANDSNDRTVEEGDIYRVSATAGQILNLNSYRGLQVIDVNDPATPRVIGRLAIAGTPVEMYQVGTRVYVLLNNWRGYYGTRGDVRPETFEGGVVVAVDVSDPRHPVETGRAQVPGWIRTSRLTRGGGQEALFVVATNGDRTAVKSFGVSSAGALTTASELDLGGYVTDIAATPARLFVARQDWSRGDGRSDVSIVDISDPTGAMVQGASVLANGFVATKFNMHLQDNILRVVSSNSWGSSSNTNHLQTFDVSDLHNPTAIDAATFGDEQQLFATIFFEDKAFFVTYLRRDPFHSFSIDATGHVREVSEFIVSGWNDYFRGVASDSRLIGIGKNDENGPTKLAVSLYDITTLNNPNPLLARAEIDLAWAWSQANWDDKAFSVLEDAVDVTNGAGDTESGLVLLPFSGWDEQNGYTSGVQMFTFSDHSITKRGIMTQDSSVRRSFVADPTDSTTGNLSDEELSLFNTANPDNPLELGRLELAPSYSQVLTYGSHAVRRHSKDYYGWYRAASAAVPSDKLEVVSMAGDVDADEAIASIDAPAGSSIHKVGNRLAVVSVAGEEVQPADPSLPKELVYRTKISLFDLSNPAQPAALGELDTTDLPPPSWYYYGGPYYGGVADCFDCGRGFYYGGQSGIQTVGNALVFVESVPEQELEGVQNVRSIYPTGQDWQTCWDSTSGQPQACTYVTGGIDCRSLTRVDGTVEPEVCTGALYSCDQDAMGMTNCTEVDQSTVQTQINTYSYDQYRYWQHLNLHAVDVSGSAPVIGDSVSMAREEESVSLLANGSHLFLSFKKPFAVASDPRAFVRYYFRDVDFTNANAALVGADINVPGELIAIDGATAITRDFVWGENIVETTIDKLEVVGDLAYLRGVRTFTEQYVDKVLLDGVGHVLVSHRLAWQSYYPGIAVADRAVGGAGVSAGGLEPDYSSKLSIIDLADASFPVLAETAIDSWATLTNAVVGRALFTVPGGLLVVNLDNASAPFAQAYFPLNGWSDTFAVTGRDVLFAAGRYGLYKLDIDTFNLLPPAAP